MPLSVISALPSPSGRNDLCATPQKPGVAALYGVCFILGSRPTNGGSDGFRAPCNLEITAPKVAQPPAGFCEPSVWPVKQMWFECSSRAPTMERIGVARCICLAISGSISLM